MTYEKLHFLIIRIILILLLFISYSAFSLASIKWKHNGLNSFNCNTEQSDYIYSSELEALTAGCLDAVCDESYSTNYYPDVNTCTVFEDGVGKYFINPKLYAQYLDVPDLDCSSNTEIMNISYTSSSNLSTVNIAGCEYNIQGVGICLLSIGSCLATYKGAGSNIIDDVAFPECDNCIVTDMQIEIQEDVYAKPFTDENWLTPESICDANNVCVTTNNSTYEKDTGSHTSFTSDSIGSTTTTTNGNVTDISTDSITTTQADNSSTTITTTTINSSTGGSTSSSVNSSTGEVLSNDVPSTTSLTSSTVTSVFDELGNKLSELTESINGFENPNPTECGFGDWPSCEMELGSQIEVLNGNFSSAINTSDSNITSGWASITALIGTIKTEASALINFTGGGAGSLPCTTLDVGSFGIHQFCFTQYESILSQIGAVLVFMSLAFAAFIILRN